MEFFLLKPNKNSLQGILHELSSEDLLHLHVRNHISALSIFAKQLAVTNSAIILSSCQAC
jgi:hypothetical protein